MNNRLLLVYLPTPNQVMTPSPYLGLAVLKGYLSRAGKDVRIDDLEMKYWDKDMTENSLLRSLLRRFPLYINNPKKIFLDRNKVNCYLDEDVLNAHMRKRLQEWESLLIESVDHFSHVGISVMGPHQLSVSLCFAKYLKDKYKVKIVLGGSFFTQRMGIFLEKYSFIDYIVVREGEGALNKLLEGVSPENIENLLYRAEGGIRVNPLMNKYVDNMEADFTDLPFDLYKKDRILIMPYETSKGCTGNCSYCVPSKKPLYFKKPEIVADEIERIRDRYNVHAFFFVDNGINIDREYAVRISEEFIRRKLNVQWSAYFKARDEDKTYFKLLHEAGCVQLRWGIEIINEELLLNMNKQLDFNTIPDALRKSASVGIWNHLLFMMSSPEEKWIDVLRALLFLIAHKAQYKSAVVNCFNISGIDRLLSEYTYKTYKGTIFSRKTWEECLFNLTYKAYKDRFFPVKFILFHTVLHMCGMCSNDKFLEHKLSGKERMYIYNTFDPQYR